MNHRRPMIATLVLLALAGLSPAQDAGQPTAIGALAAMARTPKGEDWITPSNARQTPEAGPTPEAGQTPGSGETPMGLVEGWLADGQQWITDKAPLLALRVLLFLAILLASRILSRLAGKAVERAIAASRLNVSGLLHRLFVNAVTKVVFLAGLLVALSQVGVEIGPIIGALGVAGFVLGFALQETLSNFAAGVMILLYRPYDVGDFVTAGGVTGKATDMTLVSTTFLTSDNQKLVVPNSKIWGGVIQNTTANDTRRVDLVMGCGYDDDLDEAEAIIRAVVSEHELVLEEPKPVIRVNELGDSCVNFVVRPWCRTSDYSSVRWDLTKALKQRFDAEGLSIPFPQRDVHVHQTAGAEPAAQGT